MGQIQTSIGGALKKVKNVYLGVGDVPKKVKQVYIGVDGMPKKVWSSINGNIVITKAGASGDYVKKLYYIVDLGLAQPVDLSAIGEFNTSVTECKVACSKTRFVIVTSPTSSSLKRAILYSDNLTTWVPISSYIFMGSDMYMDIKYFEEPNLFIINMQNKIYYSNNGTSWSYNTVLSSPSNNIVSIAYGESKYVISVNNQYSVMLDEIDGTPTSISTVAGQSNFSAIAYGNGKFVSYRPSYGIYYLDITNKTWILATNLISTSASHSNYSIIFGNGMFVFVSTSINTIYYSYDGVIWNSVATSTNILKVSFDGDKFIGTTANSMFAYSYDAKTWTFVSLGVTDAKAYYGIAGN